MKYEYIIEGLLLSAFNTFSQEISEYVAAITPPDIKPTIGTHGRL